ncbi:MAG: fatty acid desaturase [Nitratireductor sp.]
MLQTTTQEKSALEWDWINVIGITIFHLMALLALFPQFFSWTGLLLAFLGNYVFGTLGINLFYHRFLTHKGFQCPKWLERTLAVLAVCCFQDSPARWVAVHRRHHEFSDKDADPHSPVRGFLWAHIGWVLVKSADATRLELYARYAKDVLRDPFYRKLEEPRIYVGVLVLQCLVFFGAGFLVDLILGGGLQSALVFGASLLIWGVFVRTVFVWHATWSVNSVTHVWGYQNYDTGENSRNNILIGYLTNGEGWHNNHHADPRSARHGHRPFEFDLTWLTIRFFASLGLAWNIKDSNITPKVASQS